MRLQKAQVQSSHKVVGGVKVFDRLLPMHAGFSQYTITLVGAAGGYGGESRYNNGNRAKGGGPGGGGFLVLTGSLDELSVDLTTMIAGVPGTNGVDRGNNQVGGNGTNGGLSSFNGDSAYGGQGGGGGLIEFSQNLGGVATIADGGTGGHNSLGLGIPGEGSDGRRTNQLPMHTDATEGIASQSGGSIGGGGGGGESGVARTDGETRFEASSGKTGNVNGFFNTDAPGGTPPSGSGGCGGGVNIGTFTGGADEFYGSHAAGSDPNGVAYLRLS